eukprot:m.1091419 g.1091419  ORF g.1091419 m.1091419 type:complete len:1666 (-) comp24287_c0_seq8:200-5197(-)
MAKVLKKAKLAIKEKNFEEAEELCKEVLESEKDNYHAFVFLSVAYAKTDRLVQAEDSYRKATELKPDETLAWQGLASLYENSQEKDKLSDTSAKLIDVYRQLLICYKTNPDKSSDVTTKLEELLKNKEFRRQALDYYMHLACDDVVSNLNRPNREEYVEKVVELGPLVEDLDVKQHAGTLFLSTVSASKVLRCRQQMLVENKERFSKISKCCRDLAELRRDDKDESARLSDIILRRLVMQRDTLADSEDPTLAECATACINAATVFAYETLLVLSEQDGFAEAGVDLTALAPVIHDMLPESALAISVYASSLLHTKGTDADGMARLRTLLTQALELDSNCVTALHAQCHLAFRDGDFEGALDFADRAVSVIGQREQQTSQRRWNHMLCAVLVLEGRAQLRCSPDIQHKAADSFQQVVKLAPNNADALCGMAEVTLVCGGDVARAHAHATAAVAAAPRSVAALGVLGWVEHAHGDVALAEQHLRDAIAAAGEDNTTDAQHLSQCHFRLGRVLAGNSASGTEESLKEYIRAVQLDGTNSDAFSALGCFYDAHGRAPHRAQKCFEKALSLQPLDMAAASALVRIYTATGDRLAIERVCGGVTAAARGRVMETAAWAWQELAATQIVLGKTDDAVASAQGAVRASSSHARSWYLLGAAYRQRGSYVAALKAFERCEALDAEDTECMYEMACVDHVLHRFPEAIARFTRVLAKEPLHLAARYDLARTWFNLAREQFGTGVLGSARDALNHAAHHVCHALDAESSFTCLWKLLGDVAVQASELPTNVVATITFPEKIVDINSGGTGTTYATLQHVALQAYTHVVNAAPSSAAGWLDLALCHAHALIHASTLNREGSDAAATTDSGITRATCMEVARRAVSCSPQNAVAWNTLGVVAAIGGSNYGLAQHAFIKSIECDGRSALPWVNLGALYLSANDIELANKSFTRAQAADPSLSRPWVGQALIAETIASPEALDLFRHAYELHAHPEALYGFGYNVAGAMHFSSSATADRHYAASCQHTAPPTNAPAEIDDTEPMKTSNESPFATPCFVPAGYERQYVEQAIVALVGYVRSRNGFFSAQAHNCLGLLYEVSGSAQLAQQMFARALELVQTGTAIDVGENKAAALEQLIRLNLARSQLAGGNYSDALASYRTATVTEFPQICELGLTTFYSGNVAASYQVYEQALAVATKAGHLQRCAEVHVALASVACARNDLAAAKQLMFRAVGTDPRHCPRALFVMCAIGLVNDDAVLAEAALKEFPKLLQHGVRHMRAHLHDYSTLQACMHLLLHRPRQALQTVTKAIHAFPAASPTWAFAAELLTAYPPAITNTTRTETATSCTASASTHGTNTTMAPGNSHALFTILARSAMAVKALATDETPGYTVALCAAGALLSGDGIAAGRAFRQAQIAVHENPASPDTWAALAVAAYVHGAGTADPTILATAVLASDRCLEALVHMPAHPSPIRQATKTVSNTDLQQWAEVHACACRVALALHHATPDVALVHEAATRCQRGVQAHQQNPTKAAPYYFIYSQCQLLLGQAPEAVASLRAGLRLNSTNASYWEHAGGTFESLDMRSEAATCYQTCAALGESSASGQIRPKLRLALMLLASGDHERALQEASECVRLDGSMAEVRLVLGMAKLASGDSKGAKRELMKASAQIPFALNLLPAS